MWACKSKLSWLASKTNVMVELYSLFHRKQYNRFNLCVNTLFLSFSNNLIYWYLYFRFFKFSYSSWLAAFIWTFALGLLLYHLFRVRSLERLEDEERRKGEIVPLKLAVPERMKRWDCPCSYRYYWYFKGCDAFRSSAITMLPMVSNYQG